MKPMTPSKCYSWSVLPTTLCSATWGGRGDNGVPELAVTLTRTKISEGTWPLQTTHAKGSARQGPRTPRPKPRSWCLQHLLADPESPRKQDALLIQQVACSYHDAYLTLHHCYFKSRISHISWQRLPSVSSEQCGTGTCRVSGHGPRHWSYGKDQVLGNAVACLNSRVYLPEDELD